MNKINDLYPFDKFWKVYTDKNKCISKWDENRTDCDVFINRTLRKWFPGKFFQVEVEQHEDSLMYDLMNKPKVEYNVFTKYIYILDIKFAFAPYHDLITIRYVEPHSKKIEEVNFGFNDFMNIKLMENEGDFRLLKKFYPIRIEKYFTIN